MAFQTILFLWSISGGLLGAALVAAADHFDDGSDPRNFLAKIEAIASLVLFVVGAVLLILSVIGFVASILIIVVKGFFPC